LNDDSDETSARSCDEIGAVVLHRIAGLVSVVASLRISHATKPALATHPPPCIQTMTGRSPFSE
jgi:hypothetical protein